MFKVEEKDLNDLKKYITELPFEIAAPMLNFINEKFIKEEEKEIKTKK